MFHCWVSTAGGWPPPRPCGAERVTSSRSRTWGTRPTSISGTIRSQPVIDGSHFLHKKCEKGLIDHIEVVIRTTTGGEKVGRGGGGGL